ncbi:MAG: glycosyltransferase [bacterium]|nr:glycosyltransferase [bacterium]
MKILFISYFFPPYAHATAVERTVLIAKYLSEFGHEIGIITARNYTFFQRDPSYLNYLPKTLMIARPSAIEPSTFSQRRSAPSGTSKKLFRNFLWPDSRVFWLINAVPASLTFVKDFRPDVIVSIAPPYTDLILGYLISRRFRIPHFVDLLDPWSDDLYNMYPNWWQKELTYFFEKKILEETRGVIVATYPMKWRLLERYKFLRPERVDNITFGIITENMEKVKEIDYSFPFTVLYLGTLQGSHKNPTGFIKAFAEFTKVHPDARLMIAGNVDKEVKDLIKQNLPAENVEFLGYIENEKVYTVVNRAHILWLLISRAPGFELVMPAKTISYLGFSRPILATVPEGWTAEFLRKLGVTVVDNDDVARIVRALEGLYQDYKRQNLKLLKKELVEEFEYSKIARKYEAFLKTAL